MNEYLHNLHNLAYATPLNLPTAVKLVHFNSVMGLTNSMIRKLQRNDESRNVGASYPEQLPGGTSLVLPPAACAMLLLAIRRAAPCPPGGCHVTVRGRGLEKGQARGRPGRLSGCLPAAVRVSGAPLTARPPARPSARLPVCLPACTNPPRMLHVCGWIWMDLRSEVYRLCCCMWGWGATAEPTAYGIRGQLQLRLRYHNVAGD